METPSSPIAYIERLNNWISESIMIKLLSIGFLLIILLLPASWIEELIAERWNRAEEAIGEISGKWSDSQGITGPILVIPYKTFQPTTTGAAPTEVIERAYFLPEELKITGQITPEILHRGIFDVALYQSTLNMTSSFEKPDFQKLGVPAENVIWKNAYLTMGISDLQGISDNPKVMIDGRPLSTEPANDIRVTTYITKNNAAGSTTTTKTPLATSTSGIIMKLDWENEASFAAKVAVNLDLKGSSRIGFTPTGKITTVKMSGPWANPSFEGKFIPINREIDENGFAAEWRVLHFNRPFAQSWTQPNGENNNHHLGESNFGVKLLIPVDQYQKTMRTAKYAVLMILLTFIALFLVEITQKVRIHPFQYILIGSALIIYYTLLLSLSEHVGYDWAYVIAALSTVLLIGLYSGSFLTRKLSSIFTTVLAIFYTFIFVIILEQDYSLLIGSIGLFVIVALLMFFSRKVKWYSGKDSGYPLSIKSEVG